MRCPSCGSLVDKYAKFCGNCGNSLFVKKDRYIVEAVFSSMALFLLIPLIFFMLVFYNDACNYIMWLLLITAMIPAAISGIFSTLFPNISFFGSAFFGAFIYVFVQFILNTVALIKLLFNRSEKNKIYYITLLIIIINYVMIFLFIYHHINCGSCNAF